MPLRYADIVADHADGLPLFYQPWWLDAACGPGNWLGLTSEDKGGQATGLWPLPRYRKWGHRYAAPPMLTPGLGPWLMPAPSNSPKGGGPGEEELKNHSLRDREWRIYGQLLDQLPALDFVRVKCPYQMVNWLPFERRGWRQTVRYSYVLPGLSDTDRLWNNLAGRTRTAIRKAQQQLTVAESDDLPALFRLCGHSFDHRAAPLPFTLDHLRRIDEALAPRKQRRLYLAHDPRGQLHAALYLVWDKQSAYNLLQGSDPVLRQSGAAALLLWQAILDSAQLASRFDFEGSQLPGVEEFFRGFGGELWPYYQLEWAKPWVRPLLAMRR